MSALYCVYALQVAVRSRFDRLVEKSIRDRYMEGLSRFALTVSSIPGRAGAIRARGALTPPRFARRGPSLRRWRSLPTPYRSGCSSRSRTRFAPCGHRLWVLLDGGAVRRTWVGTAAPRQAGCAGRRLRCAMRCGADHLCHNGRGGPGSASTAEPGRLLTVGEPPDQGVGASAGTVLSVRRCAVVTASDRSVPYQSEH